jgi:hypothetical protein
MTVSGSAKGGQSGQAAGKLPHDGEKSGVTNQSKDNEQKNKEVEEQKMEKTDDQ